MKNCLKLTNVQVCKSITFSVKLISRFFQVKVVFDLFDLSDPDPDGICASDFFLATGGSPVPQICGTNTGHHSKLKINLLPSL